MRSQEIGVAVPKTDIPEAEDDRKEDGLRQKVAYALMGSLVVFTSVGVGLIHMPAGLITLGITSGVYGYLLGAD